ncbi:hypothetical protein Pmar_PMAR002043 [Perkinsus marinus ATCC 50983]|uniref:Uncharacterized protein n=1 Tax=Perkinsus marinus (strain ATCC 50983 / TXsc) TaxID=423536 RepID=C5LYI6_PERM5|nr:hypothetical protein Pmar_PMAR002043 [Perkinsus marinus ATCC 50983]EEQ98224.1 hypothetical protein Pmar_PMAR002043 [Perkinsus marinus ATCC 50983]|eukprot:XP_002765507.1 hypothetical protein Pmar_PMAR002043 [Perkinsus marinus ATCC 50983]
MALTVAMTYWGCHVGLVYFLYNDMAYVDWFRKWLIAPIVYLAWSAMLLNFLLAVLVLTLNETGRRWLGYAAFACQKLKGNAFLLLPGTQIVKAAATSGKYSTAKMLGSTAAAMLLNPGSAEHVYEMLPTPMNLCFWWGIRLEYPALAFGLGSFAVLVCQLITGMVLQPVLKAGGNGAEGVTADKIQLWYALAPKNRRILYQKELADIEVSEIERLMDISESEGEIDSPLESIEEGKLDERVQNDESTH